MVAIKIDMVMRAGADRLLLLGLGLLLACAVKHLVQGVRHMGFGAGSGDILELSTQVTDGTVKQIDMPHISAMARQ